VGSLVAECERQLAVWRARYAGRPRDELLRLFLTALEREELVTVAYREDLMARRLRRMPIPDDAREVIRHALVWAWKDEEMHAVYIRGAIHRLGGRPLKARAVAHQIAGAVGGWASSVRQHVPWSAAPLSRALATAVVGFGALTGQVPRDVVEHLRYRPFRDFCLFNVDAERTAVICWARIVELAERLPDLSPALVGDFRRIVTDEVTHESVFQTLADSLDEADRLVPGVTAASLVGRIAAVGEAFLPRDLRPGRHAHPLGRGGDVHVLRGAGPADKLALFRRILDETGLPHLLHDRAAELGKPVSELRVVVKPSFMLGYHHKDRSPVTDPELLHALADYLHEHGCRDVTAVEAPILYDRFFAGRSVPEVAAYFGIGSPRLRVADLSADQVTHPFARGVGQATVSRTWKQADVRITFPKLRSHPVNLVHGAVGNLEGLGARCDEFIFAERQAHRPTSIMMLLDEFPPHFAVIDAFEDVPDGIVGMMGCRRPKAPRRFYAGTDAVAVDEVVSRHVGLPDPRESSVWRAASHWFGDPAGRTRVVGVDEPIAGWRGPLCDEWNTLLSFLAYPAYEFASGRGALFVPAMDRRAFPPLGRERWPLRAGRSVVRGLLRLPHL
jgi:uncharacterized protein (DUF362 family)